LLQGDLPMVEQEQLRVGLVGCGNHGETLAQAIIRSSLLRLVACADQDVGAARRAAAPAKDASTHDSVEALLEGSDVDAVVIATPHHLLARHALLAIRNGKHVFVEKPLALNESEARQVEFAAASADVNCMAGYSFRYSMGRYIYDLLEQGVVGNIEAITGVIGTGPMNSGWLARSETGGGPLLCVGCHLVDLLLWFTGVEPDSVYGHVQRREDFGTDESSAIQIKFGDARLAQLFVTQAAPSSLYELHVLGRSGSIVLRGRSFLQFELEVQSNAVSAYRQPTVIRPVPRPDSISAMLMVELEEFACSIEQRRPPAITASDARRVLRVLDAVVESDRNGQPVTLGAPLLTAH
jgi:predicted dehydrogenase